MAHREDIKEMLAGITLTSRDIVHDWGCGTKPVTRYIKGDYTWIGLDKLQHVETTHCVDICAYHIEIDPPATVAFCLEVLEHVKKPEIVLNNIHLNLLPGGTLYLSVPFLMDVHSEEDRWRFTDQGLRFLLEERGFEVEWIKPTENKMGWLAKANLPKE